MVPALVNCLHYLLRDALLREEGEYARWAGKKSSWLMLLRNLECRCLKQFAKQLNGGELSGLREFGIARALMRK